MKNALAQLRQLMKSNEIDAYIIPSNDPHQSEYVATYWQSRQWISGFKGSAGTLVITQKHAGLWTDSRYFLQAEKELSDGLFILHKVLKANDTHIHWLADHLNDKARVGIDGRLISVKQLKNIKKTCSDKKFHFVTTLDLINDVWTESRPPLPSTKIFTYDIRYAGTPRKEKINAIRKKLIDKKADWLLMTTLDDIAWTFNLRGRDVEYNPVFYAFALIGREDTHLFIDANKVPQAIVQELERDKIFIEPYDRVYQLNDICFGKIMIDPDDTNVTLFNQLHSNDIIESPMPTRLMKAQKSKIEVQHIEDAMIKDGIALTHAFKWLDDHIGSDDITEYIFAQKIAQCRHAQQGYFGESFSAIIGYNENGAIVHYRPSEKESKKIKKEGILLCDSGGQYIDGTTDITRTIALAEPSAVQKKHYTLVLKGHITLDSMHFPEGTTGSQLDALARQYLWQSGLNYGHGTGHGVGYFLNVHEPPQGYSPGSASRATTALQEGMLSSNEPGYYADGDYGIRIENLILVEKSHHEGFLRHRTMSFFPIDTNLIVKSLLTNDEINWLNHYHDQVLGKLGPHLDENHLSWLQQKCSKI